QNPLPPRRRRGLKLEASSLLRFYDDAFPVHEPARTVANRGGFYRVNFAMIDWVIVGGYLALSLGIGVLGKRYVGNVSHFLVAGRELGLYIGIATLAATEIGTITYMYNGEWGYKYGFASFAAAAISGLVMIFVGRTGLVISRFRELRLMTVPEYFEVKYSRSLRILTGVLVAL